MDRPDDIHRVSDALAAVEARMAALAGAGGGSAAEAALYQIEAGGGRVRAALALDAASALECSREDAVALAAGCELLHTASLVHDDLQDRDARRRGRDAVWRRYGDAIALCAGDLLLSAAYAALSTASRPGLGAHAHQRVAAVIRGQCEDVALSGRDAASMGGADLDAYLRVAAGKAGPLLSLPLELALLQAGEDGALPDAVRAAEDFAVGYQMVDDLADAETDAAKDELNIVGVMRALGAPDPRAAARDLVRRRLISARAAAAALPAGCGRLLAAHARRMAAALDAEIQTA